VVLLNRGTIAAEFAVLLDEPVEEGALLNDALLDFDDEDLTELGLELELNEEELVGELTADLEEELRLLLKLLDELEGNELADNDDDFELEFELDDGVTTTAELVDDANEDLLVIDALLAKLEFETANTLEIDEFETLDEREVVFALDINELLATALDKELAATELTEGDG
jgi:hypothetical protein